MFARYSKLVFTWTIFVFIISATVSAYYMISERYGRPYKTMYYNDEPTTDITFFDSETSYKVPTSLLGYDKFGNKTRKINKDGWIDIMVYGLEAGAFTPADLRDIGLSTNSNKLITYIEDAILYFEKTQRDKLQKEVTEQALCVILVTIMLALPFWLVFVVRFIYKGTWFE